MKKRFKTNLIIIFGISLFFPSFVFGQANDLVVQFETEPLFDESSFLPGQSNVRWVKVTNNSGQLQRIAAEAINYPGFPDSGLVPNDDLSRALLIVIQEKGGSDLYGGSAGEKSLFDFYQSGETYLSDVSTSLFKEYEFELIFPSEKENEWQSKTTSFDVLIGFQGTGGKVPPGSGGGGVPLPPGLFIKNENAIYIGTTTTKITWATSYKSTSRVIYDTQAGKFDLDDLPNYGYSFSTTELDAPANTNGVTYHEVWLNGLVPNTTYYYRCISHASPATISLEHSFTTSENLEKLTDTGSLQAEGVGDFLPNNIESDVSSKPKEKEIGPSFTGAALEGGSALEDGSPSPRFAGEAGGGQETSLDESGQEENTQTSLLAGLGLIIRKINWWMGLFSLLIVYLVSRILIAKQKKKKRKKH